MQSKSWRLAPALILTLGITTSAQAADPWTLIDSVTITEVIKNGEWRVDKEFPDALRAMADGFTVTGYYVPVEAQAYVRSFLLVPDPADCPFCGFGGYGMVLEVHLDRRMRDVEEATQLTVRGRLELNESDETYQTVVLREGRVLRSR